jgi:PhnB protein
MAAKRHARPAAKVPANPPIPAGFGTVTPYLAIDGGAEAIEFYRKAFGAKELRRQTTPDGKIIHARLKIGNSLIMLSDVFPGSPTASPASLGGSSVTLHIYSSDVDRLWSRAVGAGAKISMPLENQFWGERYGQLVDPFGHRWSVAQPVRMSKAEMKALQDQALAMFQRGEHPGRPESAEAA